MKAFSFLFFIILSHSIYSSVFINQWWLLIATVIKPCLTENYRIDIMGAKPRKMDLFYVWDL